MLVPKTAPCRRSDKQRKGENGPLAPRKARRERTARRASAVPLPVVPPPACLAGRCGRPRANLTRNLIVLLRLPTSLDGGHVAEGHQSVWPVNERTCPERPTQAVGALGAGVQGPQRVSMARHRTMHPVPRSPPAIAACRARTADGTGARAASTATDVRWRSRGGPAERATTRCCPESAGKKQRHWRPRLGWVCRRCWADRVGSRLHAWIPRSRPIGPRRANQRIAPATSEALYPRGLGRLRRTTLDRTPLSRRPSVAGAVEYV